MSAYCVLSDNTLCLIEHMISYDYGGRDIKTLYFRVSLCAIMPYHDHEWLAMVNHVHLGIGIKKVMIETYISDNYFLYPR